jgi:hypothetical protein
LAGSNRKLKLGLLLPLPLALAGMLFGALGALTPNRTAQADCVFPVTPTTYEDIKDRKLFLETIDLAAYNMLFPGDPYFGLPQVEIGTRDSRSETDSTVPPVLLKAIAWIESSITQGATNVPFGSIGDALVSFDCGHGVTQVTTGMTVPTGENGRGSPEQALVATNFAYNIARGAHILVDKWNEAPEMKPIVGTDTQSHPAILENWYYAVWSYNGFTGPGANRSNHPMDPIYGSWPREPFGCGVDGGNKGRNRGNYPYQELVFGCVADPPVVDGEPLWQAQAITLPDLNDPKWGDPLSLDNFVFPYAKMDIPSPQPFHSDTTPKPDPSLRDEILGDPQMALSTTSVKLGFTKDGDSSIKVVDVDNSGTGVLSWYATSDASWLVVSPYTGVAVGSDLPCEDDVPCDRTGKLQMSIDQSKLPSGHSTATVTVQGLGTDQTQTIKVEAYQAIRMGAPGVTRN